MGRTPAEQRRACQCAIVQMAVRDLAVLATHLDAANGDAHRTGCAIVAALFHTFGQFDLDIMKLVTKQEKIKFCKIVKGTQLTSICFLEMKCTNLASIFVRRLSPITTYRQVGFWLGKSFWVRQCALIKLY